MYPYNLLQELAEIQNKLSKKIIKKDSFQKIETVAVVDISFEKDNCATTAALVMDFETLQVIEEKTLNVQILFPYIAGFLGFREADGTVSVLKNLENNFDVLMVNGHGIMHPRGFGLASHVGLLMNMPTIGIAKQLPPGKYNFKDEGEIKYILSEEETVGANINRNYISIGHKISLKSAIDIVLKTSVFKTPEPIRKAHILATETMKNKIN
ncbi:endonuclease V [Methanobacterium sp. ACI-7]|uniref:endonuclease V n=1 Tax=unclassified Methanobacterium TaxID=2627676 RepID=UPI0039C3CBE9